MLLLASFLVNEMTKKQKMVSKRTVLWTMLCFAMAREIQSLVKTQVL